MSNQPSIGSGIDYQAQMAESLASIAESLKAIAENSKESAVVLRKINSQCLPPSFLEMTEAWRARWSAAPS